LDALCSRQADMERSSWTGLNQILVVVPHNYNYNYRRFEPRAWIFNKGSFFSLKQLKCKKDSNELSFFLQ
jgi:hypothetical protein